MTNANNHGMGLAQTRRAISITSSEEDKQVRVVGCLTEIDPNGANKGSETFHASAAPLYTVSTWVIPLVSAITFHEASHGYVARLCGDDTAWRLGRVSFNPLKHIDPFGTVLLPAPKHPARAVGKCAPDCSHS